MESSRFFRDDFFGACSYRKKGICCYDRPSFRKNSVLFGQQMEQETTPEKAERSKLKKWLARFGVVGFLFFLIKGLVWIAISIFAVKGCS